MTTLNSNSPWLMAQEAQPTVSMLRQEDFGDLCSAWIREPDLFRRAMPNIDPIHFSPYWHLQILFTVLCIAERQYQSWNEQILVSLILEQTQSRAEPLLPGQLERLIAREQGGFIHDAIEQGPLTPTEMDHAVELQSRFLMEKTVFQPLRTFANPGRYGVHVRPENIREFLTSLVEHEQRISAQARPRLRSVAEKWDEHEGRLEQFRGRRMVGLETGLAALDRNLLGLRGVTLLGAAPGAGKTVLSLQLAQGVCERAESNNAAVVFISLELSESDLLTRLKCHLTETPWSDYVRGSDTPDGALVFNTEMASRRDEAFRRLTESTAGNRLCVLDRGDLRDHSANHVAAVVNDYKRQLGAERVLVVIDYLQLLELNSDGHFRSDLEADKARFRVIQQIAEKTRSPENPFGSAVIAISEARKPVGDARKSQIWGTSMADLMGTSRLGYGADAVLMMRRMDKEDINAHYGESTEDVDARLERKRSQGVTPLILSVGKGRDGMTLGDIPLEFHFLRSKMTEIGSTGRTGRRRTRLSHQRSRVASGTEV